MNSRFTCLLLSSLLFVGSVQANIFTNVMDRVITRSKNWKPWTNEFQRTQRLVRALKEVRPSITLQETIECLPCVIAINNEMNKERAIELTTNIKDLLTAIINEQFIYRDKTFNSTSIYPGPGFKYAPHFFLAHQVLENLKMTPKEQFITLRMIQNANNGLVNYLKELN
jgi:hypothetical protein